MRTTTLFPELPAARPPGIEFVPVRLGRRPFPYGHNNKPHINLDDLVAANPNYICERFGHDRSRSRDHHLWRPQHPSPSQPKPSYPPPPPPPTITSDPPLPHSPHYPR